jgi:hypothetical protein
MASDYYPSVYPQAVPGHTANGASPSTGTGAPGKDGATIINGNGAPIDSQGSVDDLYYQLDGPALWGPKTGNGWGTSGLSLVGKPGIDGSKIYRVHALPSDASAYQNGDILIDDNGNLAQVSSQ